MLKDKTIIYLLLAYIALQLGTLFLEVGIIFLFGYIITFVVALVYFCIKIGKKIVQNRTFVTLINFIGIFFIANAILFLVYLPTLIYNPEVNWRLKGEAEQDPMILQAFVPIVFFIIAIIFMLFTVITIHVVLKYKRIHLVK